MTYFITIIYLVLWIISIFGYGLLITAFLKYLKIKFNFEKPYSATIIGLSGFIFIYFLSSIINFFLPLNKYVALIILIFGIIVLILNRKKVAFLFNKNDIVLILLLLIFICFIPFRWLQYYDTGLYHLQAIKWFSSVKLPIGLANLNYRIGFNSSWFTIGAIVEQPVLLLKVPFFISNPICIFYYGISIAFSFKELIKKTKKLSSIFAALTIIPWVLNSISSSSTPDSPVIFYTFTIIILIISLFEEKKVNSSWFIFIATLSFFVITLKISSVMLILAIPAILFMNFFPKNRNFINRNELFGGFLFSLILIPWLITGIFISGYLIFPISFTRINSLNWALSSKIAKSYQDSITAWANAPRTSMPISFANYYWFKDWIINFVINNKIIVILIIFLVILELFYLIKKSRNKYLLNYKTSYRFSLITSIVGVIFWFLNTPDYIRLGSGLVFSVLLILIGYKIFSMDLVNNLYIFFLKIKNNKKNNLVRNIILIAGIFILAFAFIFLFFKKLENPLLNIISIIRNAEINYSWIIKLKIILYIFLFLGILIIFISTFLFKKKNVLINSVIVLIFILLLNMVIAKTFVYFKEFRGHSNENKFSAMPLEIKNTQDNHQILVPIDSDQVWDAPLFSAPYFNKDLKIINDGGNSRIKFWVEK